MISISRPHAISFLLPVLMAVLPPGGLAGQVSNDGGSAGSNAKPRARDLGIRPGVLSPGPLNAITDVAGVRVGHVTVKEGKAINTGVTVIVPHAGNLYQDKVPAGFSVGNGFGKFAGSTQIVELGEIETPIVLTNTLSVAEGIKGVIEYTLSQAGNEDVRSVNAVVGETNDGFLNDIRRRVVTPDHVLKAISEAANSPVVEGPVGAGTGTINFGWKGGIGTSSRRLPEKLGAYTVGVLVQTNYGGVLQMDGIPVGKELGQYYLQDEVDKGDADGSIVLVVATDAPLSDRNLSRLAARALSAIARTGSPATNGSGDYAVAFSTAESVRRTPERRQSVSQISELPNNQVSPLFEATMEASEEAIYNALVAGETTEGFKGVIEALPLDRLSDLIQESGRNPVILETD
ncbi:MAG: P1 family peptidase [Lysobacterales bacterium]